MKIILDHYGGREEKLLNPNLQEILNCKDPFWIFVPHPKKNSTE